MRTIVCDSSHCSAILAILNHEIVTGTAVWDYEPRSPAAMQAWFEQKQALGYPVLGVVDDSEKLLGFATYGAFRAWEAYRFSAEHSVYVDATARGGGIGSTLLRALIERARAAGIHTLIAGIAADNTVSIKLHKSLGFTECGTIAQAGRKFDRWLDLSFYQLILDEPVAASAP